MTFILFMIACWAVVHLLPHAVNMIGYIFKAIKGRIRRKIELPIFDSGYLDPRYFYLSLFGKVPSISYINSIDAGKAFAYFNEGKGGRVMEVFQRNYYDWTAKEHVFASTYFRIENNILIRLGTDSAEIMHGPENFGYAAKLIEVLAGFKEPEKEKDFEINIITSAMNGLDLKSVAIKPTHLDIGLYYNDDFIEIDEIIRTRLSMDNDKGIILLHGLPGTGKTTYLRHLVGTLSKKVLFVSPNVAGNLMNPEFIDLLIDNPNAVLIIEDAENIIMDRRHDNNSSVSNLLNISDGLLSDCLNVQVICTFNSSLNLIDPALMRKGRLIAKYEFGKLTVAKAQALSDHLRFSNAIDRPMTIAEIANPGDRDVQPATVQVLGFRREALMN